MRTYEVLGPEIPLPSEDQLQYMLRRNREVSHLSTEPLPENELTARIQSLYDRFDRARASIPGLVGQLHVRDSKTGEVYFVDSNVGIEGKTQVLRIEAPARFRSGGVCLREFYDSSILPYVNSRASHSFGFERPEGLDGPDSERAMKPMEELFDRLFPQIESAS